MSKVGLATGPVMVLCVLAGSVPRCPQLSGAATVHPPTPHVGYAGAIDPRVPHDELGFHRRAQSISTAQVGATCPVAAWGLRHLRAAERCGARGNGMGAAVSAHGRWAVGRLPRLTTGSSLARHNSLTG